MYVLWKGIFYADWTKLEDHPGNFNLQRSFDVGELYDAYSIFAALSYKGIRSSPGRCKYVEWGYFFDIISYRGYNGTYMGENFR